MVALDQSAKQRRNATGQLGVALLAVGEAGAVGRIDDRGIRQQLQRWAEDRQPADAGIEEQDGGVRVHGCSVAWRKRGGKLHRA